MREAWLLVLMLCLFCLGITQAASAESLGITGVFRTGSCNDENAPPLPGVKVSLYATQYNYYLDVSKMTHLGTFTSDDNGYFSYTIQYNTAAMAGKYSVIMFVEPPEGYNLKCEELNGGKKAQVMGYIQNAKRQNDRIILDVFQKPVGSHLDSFWFERSLAPGSVSSIGPAAVLLSGPVLSIGSIQGSSGITQVPVTVKGANTIGNMDIAIDHSFCTGLKYSTAVPGSLTQNSLISAMDTGSGVNIGIADSKGISGDGSIIYLKYIISAVNTAPCSIRIKSVAGNRLDGTELKFCTTDGKFSSSDVPGDANRDGTLTTVDALMAVQMSTGEIPVNPVADMNGDSKVTSYDAISILKIADSSRLSAVNPPGGQRIALNGNSSSADSRYAGLNDNGRGM